MRLVSADPTSQMTSFHPEYWRLQGGSARSTDGSGFELVRQRSGRASFDFGPLRPLDRTSSLNEAKVGTMGGLQMQRIHLR